MNKTELLDLMSNPTQLANISLSPLLEVADEFPYFQTPHLLIARKIAATATDNTEAALPDNPLLSRAATYVSSREVMYKLLTGSHTANSLQQPFTDTTYISTTAAENDSNNIDYTNKTEKDHSHNADFGDELDEPLLSNNLGLINRTIDDDISEKPTEAISIPDNFFHHETQLNTGYEAKDPETEDVREIYSRMMEKTEYRLEEIAQQSTKENLPPIKEIHSAQHSGKLPDNFASTAEIARLLVEQELKEAEIPSVYADSDTTDLSSLLEAEARDIIRYDVERDLESLKKNRFYTAQQDKAEETENSVLAEQTGADENKELIQSLKEKVELFKKEKEAPQPTDNEENHTDIAQMVFRPDEPKPQTHDLPLLSLKEEDEAAIKGLVINTRTTTNTIDTDEADIRLENLRLSHNDDDITVAEQQKMQSLSNTESILSETMARVYARQGYFDKAIQIYEQLQAKFPEKTEYFAEKISQLKDFS